MVKKQEKSSTSKQKTSSSNTSTVIKVCLDTNILVSAIIFGGKPKEILNLGVKNKIVIIASPQILSELKSVLGKKFRWSENDIKQTLKTLAESSTLVSPQKTVHAITYSPDNRILECAHEGKVDYIVSGDKKHLLPLGEFEGIKIITPRKLLQILQELEP